MTKINANLPIGVFDSGMGGLTVLSALLERLPGEDMIYLGDTARLPYGTKSPRTVARYAAQAAGKLVERGVKLLVIACNTASATALGDLGAAWPQLPVLGVIRPGAEAACAASRSGGIAVIATESTIRNGAYQAAIREIRPQAEVSAQACSLFVPLAEEGWMDGPIVEAVARRYLQPLFPALRGDFPAENQAIGNPAASGSDSLTGNIPGHMPGSISAAIAAKQVPDCLVLGCTHFPPLAATLRGLLGPEVAIVDSAATTAMAAERLLDQLGLRAKPGNRQGGYRQDGSGQTQFLTTDDEARFARIGSLFLGRPLRAEQVELVNL